MKDLKRNERLEKQLLDYYLLPELIERKRGYPVRVQKALSSHDIYFSKQTIYQRAKKILDGEDILRPASEFHGVPGSREGKDLNYAGFWSIIDIFLPNKEERKYIGLAANQIDVIRSHVKGKIIICEREEDFAEKLTGLVGFIQSVKGFAPDIKVEHVDIFEELKRNRGFNIFDLDLMQPIPEKKLLISWTELLNKSCDRNTPAAVNITTTIGRSITLKEYDNRARFLHEALMGKFRVLGHSQFAYKDRVIPMRAERFILEPNNR